MTTSFHSKVRAALITAQKALAANRSIKATVDPTRPESVVPSAGRLVDLTAFFATLEITSRMSSEDGIALHKQGLPLAHKLQDEYVADVNQFLVPLFDGWGLKAFKAKWEKLTQSNKKDENLYAKRVELVLAVLNKIRAKNEVFRSVFTDGRVYSSAKALISVVDAEESEKLKALAMVRPVGHMANARSWMKHTFNTLGVEVPEIEDVISDVALAQDLGARLRDLDVAITNEDSQDKRDKLAAEREMVVDRVQEVASQSVNPQAVMSTAASVAADSRHNYRTKTGRELRMSPEQEDAMMVRGRSIIAAKAGSGKSRVLAGKVVYHIKELGASPSQFIATSFSRKSAHELIERIKKYGGENLLDDGPSTDGFGTTHSIAGKLVRHYTNKYENPLSNQQQATLMSMAMNQVKMKPTERVSRPVAKTFFSAPPEPKVAEPKEEQAKPSQKMTMQQAGILALEVFNKKKKEQGGELSKYGAMLHDMMKNLAEGRITHPSPKQIPHMNVAFEKAGIPYRIQASAVKAAVIKAAGEKRRPGPRTGDSIFWKNPANQWFNLGVGEDGFVDENKKPIGAKQLLLQVTKWKANLVTPEALAAEHPESVYVAAYGAYEWLKGNAPEYAGWKDHDDTLIQGCQLLVKNKAALAQVQARYKYILVDEAQDLNHCVLSTTTVVTQAGEKTVAELDVGDEVLSFENGQAVFNEVTAKSKSSWKRGYKIKTASGRELTMSPDHKIYATPMTSCPEGKMALYLMYREGLGFRIGTTSRLFHHNGSTVGRGAQEKADAAWILEIGDTEDILYKEQAYSLKYAVPTYIFEGTVRGCDQDRIDKIFKEFGQNGLALLKMYDLSFDYPHWASTSNTRGRINRRVVNLAAHRGKGEKYVQRGSTVQSSWTENDQGTDSVAGMPVYKVKGGRFTINKLCSNYEEAFALAHQAASALGGRVVENLYFEGDTLPLTTASALFPGMKVLVHESGVDFTSRDYLAIGDYKNEASRLGVDITGIGGEKNTGKLAIHSFLLKNGADLPPVTESKMVLDEVVEVIEVTDGEFIDITVGRASNFFGNGILSHNCQHLFFGLIAGTYDPATQKPYSDRRLSADTFTMIGDDAQCVHVDTMIATPFGDVRAEDLLPMNQVISFRNGKNERQSVRRVIPSMWTWGYKVTTESGRSITMSPTHKLWATEPRTDDGQMVVYLMHRRDMGFRVGITNKGKVGREGDFLNSYGARSASEKAEKLWVLEIVENREEALFMELSYSLKYGIPTMVFNGETRGLNQSRIDRVFSDFGRNGARLLEEKHLSIDHPHWVSQSYAKHGRDRLVVTLLAHSSQNSSVSAEWTGDRYDTVLAGTPGLRTTVEDRRRLRRWFANYREALVFAQEVTAKVEGIISYRMYSPEGENLREVTASSLHVGMKVPVMSEEGFELERIVSIEKAGGRFVDLDIYDASNFYGNGILTHNCIYEFRGATPDKFIEMSDLVEGGQGFKTKMLDTNYRSGKVIIDAAQHLISHNKKQIPMGCKAHEGRKGDGVIKAETVETHEDGAALCAQTVEDMCMSEDSLSSYKDFGVAVPTNAEAFAFCTELLRRGIPFRSKVNLFANPTIKALLGWMKLASCAETDKDAINAVVLKNYGAPNFNLNKVFEDALERKAAGQNYLKYLESGGWKTIYDDRQAWRNERYVKPYMEMCRAVKDVDGEPIDVLNFILELRGPAIAAGKPGQSMLEALVEETRKDPESANMLAKETASQVSEEDVRALALAPIQPLIGLCSNYQDLRQCMGYIEKLERANEKCQKSDNPEDGSYSEPAVVIDTIHGWKGLEAKHMFVPMASGVFPNARSENNEEELAAARRLGYVAITRGQDTVTILCPRVNHLGKPSGPSMFVSEACIPVVGAEKAAEKKEEKLSASADADYNYFPGETEEPDLLGWWF